MICELSVVKLTHPVDPFFGLFHSGEIFGDSIPSVYCNPGVELSTLNRDPLDPGRVIRLDTPVSHVLRSCGNSEIFYPVVCHIVVNVIYKSFVEMPCVVEPNENMGVVEFSVYHYLSVPIKDYSASYPADHILVVWAFSPDKIAILVPQYFSQPVESNHFSLLGGVHHHYNTGQPW